MTRHEKIVRSVAVAAHGRVEHINRDQQAAVSPLPTRHARFAFGTGRGEHLVDPLRLGLASRRRRDLRWQQQRDSRLVGPEDVAAQHLDRQVLDERLGQLRRPTGNVQQRRATGRPTTAGEPILLTIDGQVIAVFRGDDFRRDAAVVSIAFYHHSILIRSRRRWTNKKRLRSVGSA